MEDPVDQLKALLVNRRLRTALQAASARAKAADPPESDEAEPEEILAKNVIRLLDRPRCVTLDDLYSIDLLNVPAERFDKEFDQFLRRVHLETQYTRPVPAALCLLPLKRKALSSGVIWHRGAEVVVSFCGTGPAAADRSWYEGSVFRWAGTPTPDSVLLYAQGLGTFSRRAAEKFERELASVLRSLMYSAYFEAGVGDPIHGWGMFDEKDLNRVLSHTSDCLEAFFTNESRSDSVDRSIRNAMLLLAEAGGLAPASFVKDLEGPIGSFKLAFPTTDVKRAVSGSAPRGEHDRAEAH